MERRSVFWRTGLSIILSTVVLAFAVPAAFGGANGAVTSAAKPQVTSATSAASQTKVASTLRTAAAKDANKSLDVLVMVTKGAGRPLLLGTALKVNLAADKSVDFWAGKVSAKSLTKMASAKGVIYVADNGKRTPPVVPDGNRLTNVQKYAAQRTAKARLATAAKAGALKSFAASVNDPAKSTAVGGAPTSWFDVGPTHKSAAAWANGFTGSGVKVAVADDGLDFAHPDLQGTQAYNTDPTSPYFGWPMAFDPFSTYLYAMDTQLGSTYIADGAGWFSSTVATISADSPTFERTSYVLPGTSKSGVYHIGYFWDENLAAYWLDGHFPALLVADETTAGVYDTVYVDITDDHDFTNDKKLTKDDPISYLDFWNADTNAPGQDGIADLSGGMLYWISDGVNNPPLYDYEFGDTSDPTAYGTPPVQGGLVCIVGAMDIDSDHGTLCASNVAAQGVIDGASLAGEYPSFKGVTGSTETDSGFGEGGKGSGMVVGAGRDAKLVAISDVYSNYTLSTLMAYDFVGLGPDSTPGTGDEVQVMSNSYGESSTDNDEWDYPSRYVTLLNEGDAPNSTFLFSTGNGGPGYGTNAPPSPSTAVGVGASTQFGAEGGWDSISSIDQVTYGDVIPFSNRGPSAMGHVGPTIVADGAYAAGDKALNQAYGDGWSAWEIWGGTSRSCPVASGNMALIYQAFEDKHGRWPTFTEAKQLMANGATDLNNDTLVQGSGSVDADRSTRLAAGLNGGGVAVSPEVWYPGSYDDVVTPAFEQLLHPGQTDNSALTVKNPGTSAVTVDVADSWMQRSKTTTFTVTLNSAAMSPYDFNRPDWLLNITNDIPRDADLMVVRVVQPESQFDTNGDYVSDNRIRLVTYDWTDHNDNGRLWTDGNSNSVVNTGEIDATEYMRFTYSNASGSSMENRVQNPLGRMHDGVFIGVQQSGHGSPAITLTFEVSYWKHTDMPWLAASATHFTLAGGASRSVPVVAAIPSDAPLGVYEGEFSFTADDKATIVPVVMTVAGEGADISYGGTTPYEQLMDNSKVFGYTDWLWRPEAGDWRFFDTVVPESAVTGDPDATTYWLAHTSWDATPTDIDTLLWGSVPRTRDADILGPTDLVQTGGSPNTNVTAGVWLFNTATGGAEDWVGGQLTSGLNKIMLHNVLYGGAKVGSSFSGEAGTISATGMDPVYLDTDTTHTATFGFTSDLALPGFVAKGFGLSRDQQFDDTISTGQNWTHEFDVSNAASIRVSTAADFDIDMYLEQWTGSSWKVIAASETGSGNEYVSVTRPENGHYRVRVYGYDVTGDSGPFSVVLRVPQGDGITVTGLPVGAVAPGTPMHVTATFAKDRTALADRDGALTGVIDFGPTGAPVVLESSVQVMYPFYVENVSPADGSTGLGLGTSVAVRFSKHVATDTLTPDSLYLEAGGNVVTGTVTYDVLTATASLSAPLDPETTYDVKVADSVLAADGSALEEAGTIGSFTTMSTARETAVGLALSSSTVKYGKALTLTVTSHIAPAAERLTAFALVGGALDISAPVAVQYQTKSGAAWRTVATGTTGADGTFTAHLTAKVGGNYRAVRLRDKIGLLSYSTAKHLSVAYNVTISAKTPHARPRGVIKVHVVALPGAAASRRVLGVQRWNGFWWVTDHTVRLTKSGTLYFYESRRTSGYRTIRLRISDGNGYEESVSNAIKLHWHY